MSDNKVKRNLIISLLVLILFVGICRYTNALIYEAGEDDEQVYTISARKLFEMKETHISGGTIQYINGKEGEVSEEISAYYRLEEVDTNIYSLVCDADLKFLETRRPDSIEVYSEYDIYNRESLPYLLKLLGFKGKTYVVDNDENDMAFFGKESLNADNSVHISDYSAIIYHDIYGENLAYIEMPIKAVVKYADQTVELGVSIRVTFE